MFEKYIQLILDKTLDCVYYFVDLETSEVIFLSETGCDFLRIPQGTYQGISFQDLFYENEVPTLPFPPVQAEMGSFTQFEAKEGVFAHLPYRHSTIIQQEGKLFYLELAMEQPQKLDLLQNVSKEISFDQAMIRCVSVLLRGNQPERAIEELLEISCDFYCCSSGSLLEKFPQKEQLLQTCHHVPLNLPHKHNIFGEVNSMDLFSQWVLAFAQSEEIYVSDVNQEVNPDSELYQMLKKRKVTSFLLAPLKAEERVVAYIFLENPKALRMDFRFVRSLVLFFQEGIVKRQMAKQMENIHDYDLLTVFLNRKKYIEQLDKLKEQTPEKLGIVFVDLNTIKEKVDALHVPFSDEKIKESAQLMEAFFKEPFYRVTNEKFICFVSQIPKESFMLQVDALRIETVVNPNVEFSVGYSWETGEEKILWQIEEVDQLMCHETLELPATVKESQLSVHKDLLQAIESKEFQIYLQSKVRLKDRVVVGAEALVRRKSGKEDNLLYPSVFVQLYEEQSIIRHLDLYVVDQVCQILAKWREEGIEIPISVNFSRITLTEYGIVKTVCNICKAHKIPHHLLVIEFTEHIAMMNEKAYQHIAEDFSKEGFALSLDDFGAAYSNLITLARIDLNEIKIDRTLVQDVDLDKKNQIILKSIIEMCHVIDDVSILAEGIETDKQAETLEKLGCLYGQGNLFSYPMSENDFYQKFLA